MAGIHREPAGSAYAGLCLITERRKTMLDLISQQKIKLQAEPEDRKLLLRTE